MKLVTTFPFHVNTLNLTPVRLPQETIPINFLLDTSDIMSILTFLCGFPLLFCTQTIDLLLQHVFFLCYLHLSSFRYTCSASDISTHHSINKFHSNTWVLPFTLSVAFRQVAVEQLTHPFPEMLHNTTESWFWSWYILLPSSNWRSNPVTAKHKSWMELCQSVLDLFYEVFQFPVTIS